MQPGHDRPDRHRQAAGELGVAFAVDLGARHELQIIRRDARYELAQLGGGTGVTTAGPRLVRQTGLRPRVAMPAPALPGIEVEQDPREPRAQIRAFVEAPAEPEGARDRLLHEIVGVDAPSPRDRA